jgi:hypothetical protein
VSENNSPKVNFEKVLGLEIFTGGPGVYDFKEIISKHTNIYELSFCAVLLKRLSQVLEDSLVKALDDERAYLLMEYQSLNLQELETLHKQRLAEAQEQKIDKTSLMVEHAKKFIMDHNPELPEE